MKTLYECEFCGFQSEDEDAVRREEGIHTNKKYKKGDKVGFRESMPCFHIGWVVTDGYYKKGVAKPKYYVVAKREDNPNADEGWLGSREVSEENMCTK